MIGDKELISVVIPVYRVEAYLSKCIESVINQTYRNLEIILVNDGSPDHCPQMLDEYAQKDTRIKVIHQLNGGLSRARNAGIDIATGHYIGFVDSDDYIEPTMYERLYEGIQLYACDIAICNHYVEEKEKLLMEMPPVDQEYVYSSREAIKLLLEDKGIKNYAWDKLYRRDLFQGIRYPAGRNYEDIATTYQLFDKAKRICKLQAFEYYYMKREDAISNNNAENKWYRNCKDIVTSMKERYDYFSDKNDMELKEISLSMLITYMISMLMLGYKLKHFRDLDYYKKFLKNHREEIAQNTYITLNDKMVAKILTYSTWISCICVYMADLKNKLAILNRINRKIKSLLVKSKRFDFSLQAGKQVRIFLFELPCFDNLGDHAIAYAEKIFLQNLSSEMPEIQVIEISGWDTAAAVRQLSKEKSDSDVFICQGGGNMGNLYGFGEALRRTIMRAFPENLILVFPQTIYFTNDKEGKRELKKSKRVYNKCNNLTLLARDQVSYERMRKDFRCKVIPMVDIVNSIDATEYSSQLREGSILCLRSDNESALTKEDKKKLRTICERLFDNNLITDTVTKMDVEPNDREELLKAKWRIFGKAKVVVTDRLHGMIFSLITATPCLVLGNNHHKVKEAYKTLAKCNYLYYVDSIDEVESVLVKIKNTELPSDKTDFSLEFQSLYRYLVGNIRKYSDGRRLVMEMEYDKKTL